MNATSDVRALMVVSGRVQGVCFRMAAREQARALELRGWVRNRPDGTVALAAEGPAERVRELEAWCRRGGPPLAHVMDVKVVRGPATGGEGPFAVVY